MNSVGTPDRKARLAQVAYLYYKEKLVQQEIADLTGLSRSQISRMLTEAEKLGIVRIEIDGFNERLHQLEQAMCDRFGLEDAVVVYRNDPSDLSIRKTVGRAAANYVNEVLVDGECIGVTSGRTLREVGHYLRTPGAQHLKVVQLMGGASATAHSINPEELVRTFAKALGATSFSLHAPLILETREACAAIRSSVPVQELTRLWDELTMVVMGVGNLAPSTFLAEAGWFTVNELDDLAKAGACCVMCGQFIDSYGHRVPAPSDERLIAADLSIFQKVKKAIAVAAGDSKVLPLLAAMRGRYCNVVVTDDRTALEVLEAAKSP